MGLCPDRLGSSDCSRHLWTPLGMEVLRTAGVARPTGVQDHRGAGRQGTGLCPPTQHERALCAVRRLPHTIGNAPAVRLGLPSEEDCRQHLRHARAWRRQHRPAAQVQQPPRQPVLFVRPVSCNEGTWEPQQTGILHQRPGHGQPDRIRTRPDDSRFQMGRRPLLDALYPPAPCKLPRVRHRLFQRDGLSILTDHQGAETDIAMELPLR